MTRSMMLLFAVCVSQPATAEDGAGSAPVCKVTILSNDVGQPDDHQDSVVRMRVFVTTSTSCRSGEIEVGVFPTSVCRKRPREDLDDSKPMTLVYKPKVLRIAVEPGNISSGVVEISSGDAGMCTFNSHIANCGTVAPAGAKCETRDLTDPRPEHLGGLNREFNRFR